MKFTRCSYCDSKMYVGSDVYEYEYQLFCKEGCVFEYVDNKIGEGELELSDCDGDDEE